MAKRKRTDNTMAKRKRKNNDLQQQKLKTARNTNPTN